MVMVNEIAIALQSPTGKSIGSSWSTWFKSRRPTGTVLHLSNKLGKLSHWLSHDDSTININTDIIIMSLSLYINDKEM